MKTEYVVNLYSDIADFFGVKPAEIKSWAADGMPCIRRGRGGKYDLSAIAQWRIIKLLEEQGLEGEETPALEEYRKARAELSKLELKEKTGELRSVELINYEFRDAAEAIQAIGKGIERVSPEAADIFREGLEQVKKQMEVKWNNATKSS